MDLHQQIEHLQVANGLLLGAVILLVCGWLSEDKWNALYKPKQPPEMCKLHQRPRSQCKPEEHDE